MTDEQKQPTTPETGAEPGNKTEDKGEKTFTQTELNRIIDERLERERKKYTDYGDLKKAAEQWKAHEDAQKTELQKLQEQLSSKDSALEKAAAERKTALIQAAVIAEAGTQGVAPDRLKAALKLLDISKLTIAEDGTVGGMADALKALLEENPFLKAEEGKSKSSKVSPTNPAFNATPNPDQEFRSMYGGAGRTFGDGGLRQPTEKK